MVNGDSAEKIGTTKERKKRHSGRQKGRRNWLLGKITSNELILTLLNVRKMDWEKKSRVTVWATNVPCSIDTFCNSS